MASPSAIKLLHFIQSTTEISPYHVIDALLRMQHFPKAENSFVTVADRVKIPIKLCDHLPRYTAKSLLMAMCPLVGTSWALTNKDKSASHHQLYKEMHENISHVLPIEALFRIECHAIRQFVMRLSVYIKHSGIRNLESLVDDAVDQPWQLSYKAGEELGTMCQILDVACVKCTKEHASFIVDGQIFIKCCKRDKILLLMVSLAKLPKFKNLLTDLSFISAVSSLASQLNPRMESPTASPSKRAHEEVDPPQKRTKSYDPKESKEYTDEEWRLVQEVQGVSNMPLPGFKFTVNATGNAITLEIDGTIHHAFCV